MSIQTHEQILMEQFEAVLADLKLWTELYEKTRKRRCLLIAAEKWGVLKGIAMAAGQFGIPGPQAALDGIKQRFRPDGIGENLSHN